MNEISGRIEEWSKVPHLYKQGKVLITGKIFDDVQECWDDNTTINTSSFEDCILEEGDIVETNNSTYILGVPSDYMKRQDVRNIVLSDNEINRKIAELTGEYDVNPFVSRSTEGVFVSHKVSKEVSCIDYCHSYNDIVPLLFRCNVFVRCSDGLYSIELTKIGSTFQSDNFLRLAAEVVLFVLESE